MLAEVITRSVISEPTHEIQAAAYGLIYKAGINLRDTAKVNPYENLTLVDELACRVAFANDQLLAVSSGDRYQSSMHQYDVRTAGSRLLMATGASEQTLHNFRIAAMFHDAAKSMPDHPLVAVAILDILFPRLQADDILYKHIKQAIGMHSGNAIEIEFGLDAALDLDSPGVLIAWLRKQRQTGNISVETLGLLAADKSSLMRGKIENQVADLGILVSNSQLCFNYTMASGKTEADIYRLLAKRGAQKIGYGIAAALSLFTPEVDSAQINFFDQGHTLFNQAAFPFGSPTLPPEWRKLVAA